MRPRTPATRVLLAGAALLGLAWLLAPAPSPPLYDGLQGPAQPYLYLKPPPGYHQAAAPAPASVPLKIVNGATSSGYTATPETPPQAQVLVGDGTFAPPAGATTITLSITPVAPPAPLPASLDTLDGNVYRIEAVADNGAAVIQAPSHPITVVLRGPSGVAGIKLARFVEGGTWTRLTSSPVGAAPDMLAANTDQIGWFAMTAPPPSTGGGTGGGSSGFPVLAVALPAAALLLILATLLVLRRSRSDRHWH